MAVVTGSARGFGRAISEGLAKRGADIVAVDIADCSSTADAIQRAGRASLVVRADVTDPAQVDELAQNILSRFGRCDILVNNVGSYPLRDFGELEYGLWREVLALNLDSQFLMAKALVDPMKEQRWGRIINVTSNSLMLAIPGLVHYMASKAGFGPCGMQWATTRTRGLATDLAPFNITVNAVGPTATPTEGASANGVSGQLIEMVVAMQAIKRPATPEDIVGTVSFLASDDAAFLTGQTIMVDGGLARI
ncbi:SDR family NAD(P)-dependent oxidoreductase [uncultured Mycobacterium sp.]|uniref:SDR family NAD(P)-dependent oxidoreductase n=1 Tax=uncultured Mycobacterium sp. TaxID=171292 RepID=UPI0035CB3981